MPGMGAHDGRNTHKVGIGTASPAAPLDVNGNVTMRGGVFNSYDPNTPANFLHRFTHGGLGDAALQLYNAGTLKISLAANGNSYFNNAGNVGIGTASPLYKLQVNYANTLNATQVAGSTVSIIHNTATVPSASQETFGGLFIGRDKASAAASGDALGGINFGIRDPGTEVRAGYAAIGAIANDANTAHLTFYTASSPLVPVERMRVTSTGNVGIGTASPDWKLTVNGGTVPMRLIGLMAGYGQLYFDANPAISTDNWIIGGIDDGNGGFAFRSPSTGVRALYLHQSGNVQFSAYGAGTLVTDGSGWITASSDERLKDIKGPFKRGLADLINLDPILYKWNKKTPYEKTSVYAGFSAQNVQKHIPEAVGKGGDGYLTLQDRPLLAASVNAIKELKANDDALEAENEALDAKNNALEARIEKLEKALAALKAENNALEKRVEAKNSDLEARIEKLEKERRGEQ